jgi:hypothetical protein
VAVKPNKVFQMPHFLSYQGGSTLRKVEHEIAGFQEWRSRVRVRDLLEYEVFAGKWSYGDGGTGWCRF